ncbi:MAG TPA: bifunctional transaldolase/phosoglucose isomerase, partial [Ktedonobacterales bacterium]|nr:bifunctional transaldolase/phosoglucose isomerase [Ktedonobacterales bacterium]
NDTQGTIAEVRRLFGSVDRPNVMIKIPATAEGVPAIEQMIYEGVNINITLIFALEAYQQVVDAYIHGLERRLAEGKSVKGIASVASFFVSRVDTLVDKQLDELATQTDDAGRKARINTLKGKAAIANARLAYEIYEQVFHGERFAAVREAGAGLQRCLWASTSTKNPAYRDVLYVEELIGPETVDTLPPQTIVAFQDHGEVSRTVDQDYPGAHETMRQLAEVGIDMAAVTKQLEIDGVKAFADSFNELLKTAADKTAKLKEETQGQGRASDSATRRQQATLGALADPVEATLDRADSEHFATRVWRKDPAFWKPNPAEQQEITNRLGWLTVTDEMRQALPRLDALRDSLRADGVTHVVVMGMGGSSLAPDVFRATFGVKNGQPNLIVLDSTDPATIVQVEQAINLPHTVFIVASKSGGTIETLSHYEHFRDKVNALGVENPGAHFIAITDPGTKLDTLAAENRFRDVFRNPTDIGGRYSALSFFGLVPAAIIGVDVEKLLDRADAMRRACSADAPARENPGVWLGAIMGTLANQGHDKVTLVVSPPIATYGYWAEQLIAESTGKEGRGILPVEGEALGQPTVYGKDRLFVYLRTNEGFDPAQDQAISMLEEAGQPVVRFALDDIYDLGAEFFRWEFAIAVAGALIGINAFDQPNVQESKDNTDRILQQYAQTHTLNQPSAIIQTQRNGVAIVAEGEQATKLRGSVSLQAALETFAREANAGDYIALLA